MRLDLAGADGVLLSQWRGQRCVSDHMLIKCNAAANAPATSARMPACLPAAVHRVVLRK
jgi:hypothetical protein